MGKFKIRKYAKIKKNSKINNKLITKLYIDYARLDVFVLHSHYSVLSG